MKYKVLGNTGVNVSSLCLGTMTFGNGADKRTSRSLFNQCRKAGINFIDCANVYADGEAERILGGLIKGSRDELIITSKVYCPMGEDVNAKGSSRRHIMSAVEDSLKRLKTDYLDIYFIHGFDETAALEDSLRALDDLITQGKILYAGVSNFAAWQIMKALAISERESLHRFRCVQPMYSLVKRQAEVEILPMAKSENLGVISYSPLGGGLLTGKYAKKGKAKDGRLIKNEGYKARYQKTWMHDSAKNFIQFAEKEGFDPVSLAVAWAAHNSAVTAPIVGARSLAQLKPSLASLDIEMTEDLYNAISDLSPEPALATDRDEEALGLSVLKK